MKNRKDNISNYVYIDESRCIVRIEKAPVKLTLKEKYVVDALKNDRSMKQIKVVVERTGVHPDTIIRLAGIELDPKSTDYRDLIEHFRKREDRIMK